jgi:hypothetical protein
VVKMGKKVLSFVLISVLILSSFSFAYGVGLDSGNDYADNFANNIFYGYESSERGVLGDIIEVYADLSDPTLITDFVSTFTGGTRFEKYEFIYSFVDPAKGYIVTNLDTVDETIRTGTPTEFMDSFESGEWVNFDTDLSAQMSNDEMNTYFDKFGVSLSLLGIAKRDNKIAGYDSEMFTEDISGDLSINTEVFASGGMYEKASNLLEVLDAGITFPPTDEAEAAAQDFVDKYNTSTNSDKTLLYNFLVNYNLVNVYTAPSSDDSGSGGGALPPAEEEPVFGVDEEYDEEAAEEKMTEITTVIDELDEENLETIEDIGEVFLGLKTDDALELADQFIEKIDEVLGEEGQDEVESLYNTLYEASGTLTKEPLEETQDAFGQEGLTALEITGSDVDSAEDSMTSFIEAFKTSAEESGYEIPEDRALMPTFNFTTEEEAVVINIASDVITSTGTEEGIAAKVVVNDVEILLSGDSLTEEEDTQILVEKVDEDTYVFETTNTIKAPVYLSVQYTGDGAYPSIYRYDEETEEYNLIGGYYDEEAAVVRFTLSSFSQYMVDDADAVEFSDIDEITWGQEFKDSVKRMSARGYVQGRGEEFDPYTEVTRAEFAAMLVRLLDMTDAQGEDVFEDVESDDWFYNEVSAAFNAGLIQGVSTTEFKPKENITREEMAVMASRMLKLKYYKDGTSGTDFVDEESISTWAVSGAAMVEKLGVMEGRTSGEFDPKGLATRLESVVVMERLLAK